ncbi:glycosyltransferase family 1 protein [Pseudonocardia sp. MCCB 268]|nr:glycosyltransferase family 1 protein [Pseudonocardia cytotoxica]
MVSNASPLVDPGGRTPAGRTVHVRELALAVCAGHDVTVCTRRDDPAARGRAAHRVSAGPARASQARRPDAEGRSAAHVRSCPRRPGGVAGRPPDVVHGHFWMSGWAAAGQRGGSGLPLPLVQTCALGAVRKRKSPGRGRHRRAGSDRGGGSPPGRPGRRIYCPDEDRGADPAGRTAQRPGHGAVRVDTSCSGPGRPEQTGCPRLLVLGRLVRRRASTRRCRHSPGCRTRSSWWPGDPAPAATRTSTGCRKSQRAGLDRVRFLRGGAPRRGQRLLRSADIVVMRALVRAVRHRPLEAPWRGRRW